MHIQRIKLSNFQCFGENPVVIELEEDITCLLGNNGSGKSAIIKAIQRMFGSTLEERTVVKSDFHMCPSETDLDIKDKQLYVDIVFEFKDKEENETTEYLFPFIYQNKEGKFCARMRLEATWNDGEYDDDVSYMIFWILTEDDINFGEESPLKIKVENYERRQISLIYVPATRDAKSILKNDMRRIIKKIERYADVSDIDRMTIETDSKSLGDKVNNLTAIQSVQTVINEIWQKAHDNTLKHYKDIKFEVIGGKFEDLVKSLLLKICPAETGNAKDIMELSDGQISLLYFALSIALYDLETMHSTQKLAGLKEQDYNIPIFTILALEEPENHLSPFYLSRILSVLEERSKSDRIINIITSHSPNVVKRMKKVEQIRFLRQELVDNDRKSFVGKVLLPPVKTSEDYKYINQAVLARPELYFSKLVVLGEGGSEEIVLPAIAQKSGYDFDSSFVSFVPLGGRHVNHMWKLLSDLKIPYITLLDYDLGRHDGGEARLHNVLDKLNLSNQTTKDEIEDKHRVYFSYPLDLDMIMIDAFSECYTAKGNTSSRSVLERAVFGENSNKKAYPEGKFPFSDEVLSKYRYLFKTKSKIASHYLACDLIQNMNNEDFFEKRPTVLGKIVSKIADIMDVSRSKQEQDFNNIQGTVK